VGRCVLLNSAAPGPPRRYVRQAQKLLTSIYFYIPLRTRRVTRLGEFLPIGRFVFFGQFFESYKSTLIVWLLLSTVKVMY
jgi:hypothetical protein